ncbi:hypothetical protein V5F77_09645 [Xanthobacter sp. DSM 24535]|uniref:hypothetical protein n=1 Tax=Roseixanthobacter psychrophilus TaxID=3119917 RepID=UPI00372ABB58
MSDSSTSPGFTTGFPTTWPAGAQMFGWPMAAARVYWVELPVAINAHLQRFATAQIQEQMRLMSEMAKPDAATSVFNKEAAFLQQSAFAWGTEMLEIVELCKEKMLNPTAPTDEAEQGYRKAA